MADDNLKGSRGKRFTTTQWSLVAAAGDNHTPDSREALASLCRIYWYPVYAHARQLGEGPDHAQDLTQGFFAYLLESGTLRLADPDRGRFRAFLKTALGHYMSNERRRERAQKRGGGRPLVSLDTQEAEARFKLEPADEATPESVFEERWARTLLATALERLREGMLDETGKARFARLEPFLTGAPPGSSYKDVAEELTMSESAVKVTVHRLRHRFGELLRGEVARTVDDPGEVEEEIRYLFRSLGS